MDAASFIENCRKIVGAWGVHDSKVAARARIAWGFELVGTTCYRDSMIEIVAEKLPSKRILVYKRDMGVPVLCTDATGYPFRWHGEYALVERHVRGLAHDIDEPPDQPA